MSTITLAFSKILETVCKNRKINYVRLMTKSGIHVHSLTNKQKKTQQQLHLKVLRAIESKQKVEEGKTLERREILEQ